MNRSSLVPLAWILVAAIAAPLFFISRELSIAGTVGFPLDDSWIHLVYARNIAHGDFFSYNPHHPVAGSTAPLWSLLLGAGFLVSQSPVVMPMIIGIAMLFCLGVITRRISLLLGMSDLLSVIVAVLVMWAPRLTWGAVSGMEVPLYTLLALTSLYLYLRFMNDDSWRVYLGWGISGIVVMARPELMLLPAFYVLHQFVLRLQRMRTRDRKSRTLSRDASYDSYILTWGRLTGAVLVAIAFASPYFLLNYSLSGSLLPLTYAAKTAGNSAGDLVAQGDIEEVVARMVLSLWKSNARAAVWMWAQDNLFLLVSATAGTILFVIGVLRKKATPQLTASLGLFVLLLCFFSPVRSVATGKLDFGQWGRYLAMMTPVMILFGASSLCQWSARQMQNLGSARKWLIVFLAVETGLVAGWYGMTSDIGRSHQWPSMDWYLPFLQQGTGMWVAVFLLLAGVVTGIGILVLRNRFSVSAVHVVLLLQCLSLTVVELVQSATENAWDVKNIEDTQVKLGHWLNDHLPAGTIYATNDVGAMAYYAENLQIVDLEGLVSPEVGVAMRRQRNSNATALWVVATLHPAYIVCFDEWFVPFVREGKQIGLLEHQYSVPIPNNLTCGGPGINAMHVYRVHEERLADLPPGTIPR